MNHQGVGISLDDGFGGITNKYRPHEMCTQRAHEMPGPGPWSNGHQVCVYSIEYARAGPCIPHGQCPE